MPKPIGQSSQRYMPGLDGLRGVAVLAVIAYHLKIDWASGGLLGVGVFFTLSGYLITDILLERWSERRLVLKEFWLARARRLLPALFVVLIVVMAWVTIGNPAQLSTLRGETVASALFFSNWWFIFQDVSYFEQFGPPSPLGHIWSLGVEEQFYIFWPWILLAGLAVFGVGQKARRGTRQRVQPRLALATLGLALVSIILMAVLFTPGPDSTRAYEGTDTRAFGLLIGAALAMVWPSRRLVGKVSLQARNTLDLVGAVGLVSILILIATTDEFSPFIYRGGLVLLSIATAMVVASVAHPSSRMGRLLGFRPLRWIGVRSYGIYLWQSPIILLTTPALAGFSLPRAVIQVGATFLIAALSWKFIEDPIRHGAIGKFMKKWRDRRIRLRKPVTPEGWGGTVAVGLIFFFALLGFAGANPKNQLLPIAVTNNDPLAELGTMTVSLESEGGAGPVPSQVAGDPTKTACTSVAYVGESTSLGMVESSILPNPAERLDARLKAVGATDQHIDIAGSRSVDASDPGTLSGLDAAQAIRDSGFKGCWVFALAVNDSGLVAADPSGSASSRIDQMLAVADGDPVLWVNGSIRESGTLGYMKPEIGDWNEALVETCQAHPEMRVYDWDEEVDPDWFEYDGVHYTPTGYSQRSRLTADALVAAFPGDQPLPSGQEAGDPESCLVSTGQSTTPE
ncbi:MAG TPA: acyltransferase family protein [Solirubrobacterales bacterium]|nr:acyltransferase family protein [Solirubrobacterales bacterium]